MRAHTFARQLASVLVQHRTIAAYGIFLAVAAFGLEWLEYRHFVRAHSPSIYILLIALGFLSLGIWAGLRFAPRAKSNRFQKNITAINNLGISVREYETLEHMAKGLTNKEIARQLGISPNTVKTHVARLFEKLEVARRTQAIAKAKELSIIP